MSPKTISIRVATPMDAPNILRLMERVHASRGYVTRPDEYEAMLWVLAVIKTGVVLVADLSNRIIGSLGLVRMAVPPINVAYLDGAWLYVQPEFVNEGTPQSLIEAAEKLADDERLGLVIKAVEPELVKQLIEQRGYTSAGMLLERAAGA